MTSQDFRLFHPDIKQQPKNLSPWDQIDIRVIDNVQLCKYLAGSAGNHWFFEGFYQEQQSKQTPAPPRLLPTFARARRGCGTRRWQRNLPLHNSCINYSFRTVAVHQNPCRTDGPPHVQSCFHGSFQQRLQTSPSFCRIYRADDSFSWFAEQVRSGHLEKVELFL